MLVILACNHAMALIILKIQYYREYGAGTRFVDLGLRTHRIKCRVHDNFKSVSTSPLMHVQA